MDTAVPHKRDVLKALVAGAKNRHDLYMLASHSPMFIPSDIAIIMGYFLPHHKNTPKSRFRRIIYEEQKKAGNECIFVDSDPFKGMDGVERDRTTQHYRLPYKEIYSSETGGAEFYNQNSPSYRWEELKKKRQITVKDWRATGSHIVLLTQKNKNQSWSIKDRNYLEWANETLIQLREYSDRPVIVRAHPKVPLKKKDIQDPIDKFSIVNAANVPIKDTMENAWASLVYSSSSAVGSVINGVPVFPGDDSCLTWPLGNHDLSKIEDPEMVNIQQWLWDLAYAMWDLEEMSSGKFWDHFMKGYNNDKSIQNNNT
jgi:hypothetical protein